LIAHTVCTQSLLCAKGGGTASAVTEELSCFHFDESSNRQFNLNNPSPAVAGAPFAQGSLFRSAKKCKISPKGAQDFYIMVTYEKTHRTKLESFSVV